ncbi:hypothetical protein ABT340_39285 [Streptosporangium sp. NPDC000239]|uniref:hypothetical protein n=1 Tax=Streptosporangium sp. NPDC000239 TaxID=3154248 RepID=UPI0033301A47
MLTGGGWLLAAALTILLAARGLHYRPALRRRITKAAARRARTARATLAALWRGLRLHPRAPHHGRTTR